MNERYKRRPTMRKLFYCILGVLVMVSVAFCWRQVKVRDKLTYVCFKDKFREPVEILYLLTVDFTLYRITSNDEVRITFSMEEVKRMMKKNGHDMTDVIVIIHNHLPFTSRRFSQNDIHSWRSFKREGFTGNFYLYLQGYNIIYELIEDDDDY